MSLTSIEINDSIMHPQHFFKKPELQDGHVEMRDSINPKSQSGSYCVVYKFQLSDGTYKAIRVWFQEAENIKFILDDVEVVASTLKKLNSPYFVQYDYYPDGILVNGKWRPMLVMDWCEGDNLKDYVSKHYSEPSVMLDLAKNFLDMVKFFHENNISHGDLQHKNIIVKQDGSLVVIDYDSVCVPDNVGKKELIHGTRGFQLSRVREKNEFLSPKVDYFSELVIYLSLLLIAHHPEVWTPTIVAMDHVLLFTDDDLANINSPDSIFQKYRNDREDNFFELVLELQSWVNFGKTIDDFKPLEALVEEYWLTGSTKNAQSASSKSTKEQVKLDVTLDEILEGMI